MKPKISIVVPIYNMELYLPRCLDSLLGQSFTEFEIIAVNDGSTDGSADIIRSYAELDARVKVIEKKNGGVSAARNDGIAAATGEYIGFVDPDDWVDQEMYGELYRLAVQDEADIVMCSYVREFGTHSKVKVFNQPEKVYYRNDEVRDKVMRRLVGPLEEEVANPELLDAWGTVWSKLYRAELIQGNELTFIDLSIVGSNEDSLFNIHACYYARSFVMVNKPYYHYWKGNAASITSKHNPQLVNLFLNQYNTIEKFLNEKQLPASFHTALHNRISMNTFGLGLNTVSKANRTSAFNKIQSLGAMLNDRRFRTSLRQFETSHCNIVWRTFFLLAKARAAAGLYLLLIAANWLRRTVQ